MSTPGVLPGVFQEFSRSPSGVFQGDPPRSPISSPPGVRAGILPGLLQESSQESSQESTQNPPGVLPGVRPYAACILKHEIACFCTAAAAGSGKQEIANSQNRFDDVIHIALDGGSDQVQPKVF
jgi:hypothetical protein